MGPSLSWESFMDGANPSKTIWLRVTERSIKSGDYYFQEGEG